MSSRCVGWSVVFVFVAVLGVTLAVQASRILEHDDVQSCPCCGCLSLPRSEIADGSTFNVVDGATGAGVGRIHRCRDNPVHWWLRLHRGKA